MVASMTCTRKHQMHWEMSLPEVERENVDELQHLQGNEINYAYYAMDTHNSTSQ